MKFPVKDILISFSIFLTCVIVAVASQVIAPSTLNAAKLNTNIQTDLKTNTLISNPFELDPEETNPTLFLMAQDTEKMKSGNLEKSAILWLMLEVISL